MAADTVTIIRDTWGIGHATAATAEGAFRAQGWVAAADRIWQMEFDRRRATGRWAEVAGPAAVPEDRFFRRLDLASVAKADWAALDERSRTMTEAYAAGVNRWLDANLERLPSEFDHHPAPPQPWEPWHCLLVYKVRHLFMGTLHRKLWRGAVTRTAGPEVARAMVGEPGAATAIVPGSGPPIELLEDAATVLAVASDDLAAIPDVDGASNSWAVHGSRTASGKPLLAGDPHRGIEFPNVYHQCHLTCDEFDVIGLGFPGVPGFPHFGHNERVAWCITHGMADDTDVFVETDGVEIRATEEIEVRGAETVTVSIASTDRGPVVLGDPEGGGPVLSMAWTGTHGVDTTFECLWPMLEADSVDGLEASVDRWVIPVNNLLTADVDGNISFRIRGRLVERPLANRWTPVSGAAGGWADLEPVPDERLHRWRNPERGFLVTANNRTGDDGPFVSIDFAGPARHDRIVELLEPLAAATVEDMRDIHGDTRSLVAPSIVDALGIAAPSTEAGRAALTLVSAWDHDVAADSAAAAVYAAVRRLWATEVGERLGLAAPVVSEPGWPGAVYASRMLFDGASTLLRRGPIGSVPGIADSDELAALLGTLFDRAAVELAERLGPDQAAWRWADLHTMASPHPLASARSEAADLHPPVDGAGGDGDTVRCAGVMPRTGDRIASSSVARYVFDLDDWERSGWVVPHGVSGVRGGGHDLDQRATWLACELLPMAYGPDAVARVAASTEVVEF